MSLGNIAAKFQRRRPEILILLCIFVPCFFFVAWMMVEKSFEVSAERRADCINSLKKIEVAKQHWVMKSKATSDSSPSWDEIIGFDSPLRRVPICAEGGTYTIGEIDEPPTCSHHDYHFSTGSTP